MIQKKTIKNIKGIIPKNGESVQDLSLKIIRFLRDIGEIDKELFSNFYEQGRTKKIALEKKIILDEFNITNIIIKNWDKKFSELGSGFSFWSGKNDDTENVKINFSIGKTTKNENLLNVISISFPYKEELRYEKESKKISAIVRLLKKIWVATEIELD